MALRLSRPQSISQGARVSGPKRLYEFTVGLASAARAGAWARMPAMAWRAVADRPYAPGGSSKALRPSVVVAGQVEVEAGAAGVVERLGHEGGEFALLAGQFLDAALKRKARSAASRASEWVRLISNWPPSNSWLPLVDADARSRSRRRVRSRWLSGSARRPAV